MDKTHSELYNNNTHKNVFTKQKNSRGIIPQFLHLPYSMMGGLSKNLQFYHPFLLFLIFLYKKYLISLYKETIVSKLMKGRKKREENSNIVDCFNGG